MTTDQKVGNKIGLGASLTAISLIILGIIQIILGETISKSVSLTANGIDCIGDGFVSAVVWVGLKYVNRPADHRFHYGYYKIENLAAILAAFVMFILAGFVVYRSYLQLINPHEISFPILGAIIAFIATIIAWALGIYKYIQSKKKKLSSLKLDAINTIKDGTASFLTVIALILATYGFTIADAVVGFIISIIIITIGYASIKESSYMLVDACDVACLDHGFIIREIAEDIEHVKEAHIVRLRRTGPVVQGELEIKVPGNMSISEFHKIKKEIQKETKKRIPNLEKLIIVAHPHEDE
jgi:cation diffusion facilitator family transporter